VRQGNECAPHHAQSLFTPGLQNKRLCTQVARALLARQERALQMQTGPKLTACVEDRERRIKAFADRLQKAQARLAKGACMCVCVCVCVCV
jgi:hypothetical protein